MKIELDQALRRQFIEEGLIQLDDVIPDKLFSQLSPLKPGEFITPQNEIAFKIITHRVVGEVLHQLTNKRPLRLIMSEAVASGVVDYRGAPFQGMLLALILPFNINRLTLFAIDSDVVIENPALAAVYGINDTLLVQGRNRPDLLRAFRSRGYNIGDRLKSEDAPLIYR